MVGPGGRVAAARERLGGVGVWLAPTTLAAVSSDEERSAAARIEAAGYRSLWSGEGLGGKEAFAHHAVLLAATERLVIGTGIANIWARHGAAMQAGGATLAEAYPGRFVLGVGVSHRQLVERFGGDYRRPLERMRGYLDDMDAARAGSPVPLVRVLAALGPRMLELARDRADGAHPFLVPVEHTELARRALGPDRLLVPHQAVVLEADRSRARAVVRANFAVNRDPSSGYVRNLARLGYGADDLAGELSDRLVDALVAWGDEAAIARRVRDHLDAGADHVLIHPLTREGALMRPAPEDVPAAVEALERLAPALLPTP